MSSYIYGTLAFPRIYSPCQCVHETSFDPGFGLCLGSNCQGRGSFSNWGELQMSRRTRLDSCFQWCGFPINYHQRQRHGCVSFEGILNTYRIFDREYTLFLEITLPWECSAINFFDTKFDHHKQVLIVIILFGKKDGRTRPCFMVGCLSRGRSLNM